MDRPHLPAKKIRPFGRIFDRSLISLNSAAYPLQPRQLARRKRINKVKRRGVLDHRQRDAYQKIPLLRFVPEREHPRVNPDTAEGRCQKKQHPLRNPLRPRPDGFDLIREHSQKSRDINREKEN